MPVRLRAGLLASEFARGRRSTIATPVFRIENFKELAEAGCWR
jgi:hypothetical protein